jgi:hypothetical protein
VEQSRAEFDAAGVKTHLVLRFREVADEADSHQHMAPLEVFDREIREVQGNTEVQIWGAGKTYEAELGFTADDGGWMSLACSNRVRMPPAGPTPQPALATLDVSAAAPSVHFAAAANTTGAHPDSRVADTPGEVAAADSVTARAQDLPMAEDPSLRGGGPDALDPEFPNPFPPEQALSTELETSKRVQPDVPTAANGYLEAAPVQPLASSVQHYSSSTLADAELEIHAELHVYGRVRPERQMRLFGRSVPLAPDGTFHVRQILQADAPLLSLLLAGVEDQTELE